MWEERAEPFPKGADGRWRRLDDEPCQSRRSRRIGQSVVRFILTGRSSYDMPRLSSRLDFHEGRSRLPVSSRHAFKMLRMTADTDWSRSTASCLSIRTSVSRSQKCTWMNALGRADLEREPWVLELLGFMRVTSMAVRESA